MLYVDDDYREWAKKHKLTIDELECASCKKKFKTTIPIRIKGYVGLEIPTHGCDRKFLAASFKPIDREEIEAWSNIMGNYKK